MSEWAERKALIAVIFIVVACIWFTGSELRYMWSARTVDAAVTRMELVQVRPERGLPHPEILCAYEFDDNGKTRREVDHLAEDWPIAKDTIAVEYIPGSTTSRVKGNDHKGWLWVSGVVLILGCGAGFVAWKFRDAT